MRIIMYKVKQFMINHDETIEKEDNSLVVINNPFNPDDIKIKTQPYTIGQIVDRLQHNEINLDTEFQRLPGLWNNTKQSRFIESLLLNLPVPVFYFDGKVDKNWEVVDGLQRVSTLKKFIVDEKLRLENLEFLKEFNDLKYSDLHRDLQRRINTFPITIYIIEKGTPSPVKYNLFSRINQGGLVLTPQEIRHAIHQGIAADTIKELADKNNIYGKAFSKATDGKIKTTRMEDRDFINRFVAFYLISYKEYKPDMDSFMNEGMDAIKQLDSEGIDKLKNDFKASMDLAYTIFGNDAFRKRYDIRDYRFPINKALFETISVTFAKLAPSQREKIQKKKASFKTAFILLHKNSKFINAITQSTASKESVEQRFKNFEELVEGFIND